MKHKMLAVILFSAIAAAGPMARSLFSQGGPQVRAFQRVIVSGDGAGTQESGRVLYRGTNAPANVTYKFIATEMSFDGTVVKGAPFSADATTETTQVLADGNRIVHKNTAKLYRDAEGRTRREQTLEAIGPWTASGEPVQLITINDPVAGVSYFLDTRKHVARRMPLPSSVPGGFSAGTSASVPPPPPPPPPPGVATMDAQGAAGVVQMWVANPKEIATKEVAQPKTESLGQDVIAGVVATGTRTTLTIPAGAMGNELPIKVVSERWYSDDLKTVVMTKHSDPRMGTTTYQLSNIQRDDPPPSLFQVPAGYTVQDAPAPVLFRKKIAK